MSEPGELSAWEGDKAEFKHSTTGEIHFTGIKLKSSPLSPVALPFSCTPRVKCHKLCKEYL